MPSNKILKAKQEMVQLLKDEFASAQTILIADYLGLTVEEDTRLRSDLRKENVTYKVVKNSLAVLAAKEAGLESLAPYFVGPTAIAYSTEDLIAPAKVLQKYADKVEVFSIKGGAMEGAEISLQEIKALSAIPPVEVLYGKIVSGLITPIAGLAIILNAVKEKAQESNAQTIGDVVA